MKPFAGGGARHEGDRPRRARDDALADGGVRAGRVHGRHPRPLPQSFGYTMAFAIGVSLFVSFTLTPMLSARLLRLSPPRGAAQDDLLERIVDAFYRPIERVYMAMLGSSMRHRWVVVLAALAHAGLVRPADQGVPQGLPARERRGAVRGQRARARGHEPRRDAASSPSASRARSGTPEVAHTVIVDRRRRAEDAEPRDDLRAPRRPDAAHRIARSAAWTRCASEIVPKLPKELRINVAEVAALQRGVVSTAPSSTSSGPDLEKLARVLRPASSPKLEERSRGRRRRHDPHLGKPELVATIDRERAADLGVSVADVAATLQLLVAGVKVSTFAEAGEQYDVRVRADEAVPHRRRGARAADRAVDEARHRAARSRGRPDERRRARRRSTASRASARSRSWPTRRRASARARSRGARDGASTS